MSYKYLPKHIRQDGGVYVKEWGEFYNTFEEFLLAVIHRQGKLIEALFLSQWQPQY